MQTEPSIFTRIINGEIPCHKVYEDDKVIAFLDIHPKQPGHTLVIPKKQTDLIWDLDDDTYNYLWAASRNVARHMGEVLGKRIGVQVEGIGVPHAHVHLVPFSTTDEFLYHPDVSQEVDNAALAEIAAKLAF